jgi:hypothetical protein
MFKLCNLKYHSYLSVIVSMRNLEKRRAQKALLTDPEQHHACIEVHLTGPEVRN